MEFNNQKNEEKLELVQKIHAVLGHACRRTVYAKFKKMYIWKTLSKDEYKIVKSFKNCKRIERITE